MVGDEHRKSSSDEENLDDLDGVENSTFVKIKFHKFSYYSLNGLRQAFQILDTKSKNCLAKTQLQVISANICNVLDLKYNAEELVNYKSCSNELTFEVFVRFLEDELLQKVSTAKIDLDKFDHFAWTIVEKERKKCHTQLLTDDELFKLWQVFNKIDISQSLTIHIEEVLIFLKEFMNAIGTPWSKGPLDDYTSKTQLTFWELVECLEMKYITANMPKRVYEEGLSVLSNIYYMEVVKSGFLGKKGHHIKTMKERWFVLVPDSILYYDMKGSRSKKKGMLPINKKLSVESILEPRSNKNKFLLRFSEKNINYELEARDQKTMNEWIIAIKKCIDHCNGPTPLMNDLSRRATERKERETKKIAEELIRKEQEDLMHQQLEILKEARDQALAQAESEATLLEDERRRREELEQMKLEYEKLLEDERLAHAAETEARAKQQMILEEEMKKRQDLEKITIEQNRILEEERLAREGLEELSKEQVKILQEERERLRALDSARISAEEQVQAAHAKLEEAENERREAAAKVEEAKERSRKIRVPVGLARPLALQQRGLTTHRGAGSFVDEDFTKTPIYLMTDQLPDAVNKTQLSEGEKRSEIIESNLVKPSLFKATFDVLETKS